MCRTAILLVLGAFACSPSSPSDSPQAAAPDSSDFERIASVKRGMPRQEVVATLGQAMTHEFTKSIDGALIECGRCRFGPDHLAWYYVFRDGRLERVVEMPYPTFATETFARMPTSCVTR
jgi:outer membrane protein assembly factor BamE (lipoprotein component of BamABCDE complex)